MTLHEFSRDVIPIITMSVATAGLVSVVLLYLQIRATTKWNKLQGQTSFLNRELDELEGKLQETLKVHSLDFVKQRDALQEVQWKLIWEDEGAFLVVKTYLNALEDIAAAVRIGFVDSDFAYALEAARMCRACRVFLPLIQCLRDFHNDQEIYVELENVAAVWEEKNQQEATIRTDVQAEITRQFRSRMGLSKRKV